MWSKNRHIKYVSVVYAEGWRSFGWLTWWLSTCFWYFPTRSRTCYSPCRLRVQASNPRVRPSALSLGTRPRSCRSVSRRHRRTFLLLPRTHDLRRHTRRNHHLIIISTYSRQRTVGRCALHPSFTIVSRCPALLCAWWALRPWEHICFVVLLAFSSNQGLKCSDGQKLTKKLATNSLTNFLSYTNSLTIKK